MSFVLANIFQPLIDVFEAVIKWLHDSVGLGWGFSIIVLTIIVRAALIPLTLKQFKSMQAMQRLAPEIKALQEKYKDDKQRQQQEMMAFYKENQVNPFGSCLPLLLQLPVFLSLFYMLRKDLRHDICPSINPAHIANPKPCGSTDASQFFFIHDITDKATGSVLVVLVVLYIGSQLASSVLMAVSADRNQRMLMIGLPFIFVTFIVQFPAGLIVYWITTNLWTVGQQYFVRRTIGPLKPAVAPAGAAAAVAGGGGKAPPARTKDPDHAAE
jgi:YidC/Oxa1 family membrane protein insertase